MYERKYDLLFCKSGPYHIPHRDDSLALYAAKEHPTTRRFLKCLFYEEWPAWARGTKGIANCFKVCDYPGKEERKARLSSLSVSRNYQDAKEMGLNCVVVL